VRKRTLAVVGALVVGLSASFLFLVVAMRTKSHRLLGAVRRFNRAFTNKLQMPSAGRPGAYASVIRHRGRTSGRSYETPVVPFPTDDGFLIALPYGPNTDWLENVLASGSAVLVTEGHTYTVGEPEVIPIATVEDQFPPNEQRSHRWFGVDQCVRLRRLEPDDGTDPGEPPTVGGHTISSSGP
jgi:deazaflavin-dependent oxidoreductase (nitroreductase family)